MKPRVIVVGGSLGGLNAALWLRDGGCDVNVFERARAPLEGRGAGIVLHPATIRYLAVNTVLDLDEISVPVRSLRYVDADGNLAHETSCRYRFTSYNALYESLLGCFDHTRYHLGAECVAFEQDDGGVTATFANGFRERCDLLMFADGINSTGRRLLHPAVAPLYAGYLAWRGLVSASESSFDEAITYHVRDDGHVLVYPIPGPERGIRLLNWLWYRNVAAGPVLDELLTGKDGLRSSGSLPRGLVKQEHVRALHADAARLPPPFAALVTSTAEPFIQVISDVAVPRMAFQRVCLIGDAAFALRPHVAAGTAKAAEDGWRLAEELRSAIDDVAEALARWEHGQLALGRSALARACDAGDRLQRGSWRIGEALPFGLYEQGDSAIVSSA